MTTGCVLILDDEALVAMLLADCLEELGWSNVESALTIEEAFDIIERHSVRLAILDCNLGGDVMAWPVADRLARDGVSFLFSSGLSGEQLPSRHADRPMLAKPFTLAALSDAVANLPP